MKLNHGELHKVHSGFVGTEVPFTSKVKTRCNRHPRECGDPAQRQSLDSRIRGNDDK